MAKLSTLLDQIDNGTILLPEFQRGYVWNRDQVRDLMRSVYLDHPVGSLLMWETTKAEEAVQGVTAGAGTHLLLLDGQQRMTTLYGVVRGEAPTFFQGNPQAFTGLHFNVESEAFEFYRPNKMQGDPLWVDVSELFRQGPVPYLARFADDPQKADQYLNRLNTLRQVVDREFHYENITGQQWTVDGVVEVFNRVNSGGTKLSKGDLALARRCAVQPGIRATMRENIAAWEESGFSFTMDWLLRNATAVATGRALFSALENVEPDEFTAALKNSVGHVGTFLDAVSGRLGLDHNQVLMGRYAVPVISRLLELNNGRFSDAAHRDKVLYWYVHSSLWGRYAGSTESYLQADYDTAAESDVDGLIRTLERIRGGSLEVRPEDFEVATRGSRFYPLLYMLTRVHGARDFGSGLELKAEMLGKLSSLQVHHVFPRSVLKAAGYDNRQVNAIANFCFLTQDTNLAISDRRPEEYFPEVEERHPGALASQWIPMEPDLWKVGNYPDFLEARRELLAEAAQDFLSGLRSGVTAQTGTSEEPLRPVRVVSAGPDDARSVQIQEMVDALRRLGFAEPELDTEISDPERGTVIAEAEAFWPDGFQHGIGKPAVLELDPGQADLRRLQELGYEVFTSVDSLLGFVDRIGRDSAGELDEASEPEEAPASGPRTADFGQAMRSVYTRARDEADYTASFFLGMLSELGPLTTARKLLHAPAVSEGFASLWERGRLDLTVEALALRPEFAPLFTEEELGRARSRLEQFGHRFLDAV